ncbi:MAG: hypothetical protein DDT36_01761 [Firmicutes bacterium]|nr:hypothetical protein [Bacillota bacterium]
MTDDNAQFTMSIDTIYAMQSTIAEVLPLQGFNGEELVRISVYGRSLYPLFFGQARDGQGKGQ